jgi:hypothetical protein
MKAKENPVGGIRTLAIGGLSGMLGLVAALGLQAAEPPAINPFERPAGEKKDEPAEEAKDAGVPGGVELSSGQVLPGLISLTRDARLKIYDEKLERQREIPLRAVKEIACQVKKEWMEREWRFKETTSNEKVYTGRSYPVREYLHTITLTDGRKITGPLAAIVYVRPPRDDVPSAGRNDPSARGKEPKVEQFVLHKRDKGAVGQELKSLLYVKRIRLGPDAFEDARNKQQENKDDKKKP